MKRRFFAGNLAMAVTLAMAWAGPRAMAADDLPKAETILDKFIAATGGKAAYQKVHSEIDTGTMSISGISGTATVYKAEPDKTYTEIVIQGVGKIQEGSDGKVAWSNSAIQGPHVKEGEEKEFSLMMARFDADVNWRGLFPKVETAGTEAVNGKDCYKVILTPKTGKPMTRFYDKETGLLLKGVMTVASPMGEVTIESTLEDYRKEGDFLRPHKISNNAMGQQFAITIDKVEYNPEIPASRFNPPEEIQALLNKDKK
jgi:outer membrane lipoprotein-sorting protein